MVMLERLLKQKSKYNMLQVERETKKLQKEQRLNRDSSETKPSEITGKHVHGLSASTAEDISQNQRSSQNFDYNKPY